MVDFHWPRAKLRLIFHRALVLKRVRQAVSTAAAHRVVHSRAEIMDHYSVLSNYLLYISISHAVRYRRSSAYSVFLNFRKTTT